MTQPSPQRVKDHYEFWGEPPPERSARCQYWVDRVARGWAPNRRISRMGYDTAADFLGVWIWEWLHVLRPLFDAAYDRCEMERRERCRSS